MSLLIRCFTCMVAWFCWLIGYRTKKPTEIGEGKTVVIVGGGFAGVTLAYYLNTSTAFHVILIDKKEYFEFTPSMLRNIVDPTHMTRTHTKYTELGLIQSSRITFIQNEVVALTDAAVKTKSGDWYKYDKLVLAMGSDYYDHIKPDDGSLTLEGRRSQVESLHSKVADASTINIFGAGLVGVELAAEIVETFPSKHIILRSREPQLLPGFPVKAQEYCKTWFESRGVEIILENSIPPFKYECKEKEIMFNCTGLKPVQLEHVFPKIDESQAKLNNQLGATTRSRNSISSNGGGDSVPTGMGKILPWSSCIDSRTRHIRMTNQFHLVGHDHIFVLGDVMIEDELVDAPPASRIPKVAYQAELQAWVVAENLKRQTEGRVEWKFPYDVSRTVRCPTLVDCSLGRRDGLIIFNEFVLPGWVTAVNKEFLEISKMLFLRGYLLGALIWFLVDPLTLIANRIATRQTPQKNQR